MDMAARTQPRNVGTHLLVETAGQYAVRLANSNDDLSAAQVLRFEVFNLLNTANFGAPAAQFGPANFGTITTALDPRVVQLAAKLWF